MIVILSNSCYQQSYANLVRHGGPNGRKASKAANLLHNLEVGLPPGIQTTNNGETRIRNCVKYDLGDGFRLITLQEGRTCVALFVGNHDACNTWLEQNRGLTVTLNENTKSITIVNLSESGVVSGRRAVSLEEGGPYLPRLELSQDVWKEIIPSAGFRFALMALGDKTSDDQIWEVITGLQEEDAALAASMAAIIEHLRLNQNEKALAIIEVLRGERIVVGDAHALSEVMAEEVVRDPINSDQFIILNDLDEAGRELLTDPTRFQEWMVFLHPGQRRVVDENFEGPAVLTGVSGSGKTCVLVHRARRLAQKYPKQAILVLTLNRSLARLIENLVSRICTSAEKGRIDVCSFHDYLTEFLSSQDDLPRFLRDYGTYTRHRKEIDALLRTPPPGGVSAIFSALDERDLKRKFNDFISGIEGSARSSYLELVDYLRPRSKALDVRPYLYEEMELVRSAFPCYENYRDYVSGYEREGRTIPLTEDLRERVLDVLHSWEVYQIENQFLDHMSLSQIALFAVDESGAYAPERTHRSVLVDEFQDFSTMDFRLLRRIPREAENGLFLTGDFAQKIYAKELSLPKVEMGPTQRTTRSIRKNYRNSRQILLAANRLLEVWPPVIGRDDGLAILDPELADRDSAMPIALKCESPIKGAWREAAMWLREGNMAFSVCIATADPEVLSPEEILRARPKGMEAEALSGDYLLNPSCVVVSDIASIKGFEFSLILVLGLERGKYPPAWRPEVERWRDALRLYVAITRGRDEVKFLYGDQPSDFLREMGELILWQDAEDMDVAEDVETSSEIADLEDVPTPDKDDASATIDEWVEPPPLTELGSSDPAMLIPVTNGYPVAVVPPDLERRIAVTEIVETSPEIAALDDVPTPDEENATATIDEAGEPTPLPEPKSDDPEMLIKIINGYPVAIIPHNLDRFRLADLLDKSESAIAHFIQDQFSLYVAPNAGLGDHIVKGVCRRYGLQVSFRN